MCDVTADYEIDTLSLCVFFNDTATTEIYTLSLHDALPIFWAASSSRRPRVAGARSAVAGGEYMGRDAVSGIRTGGADRKSTRLNSSHANISYAVFCLKKKKYRHEHITSYE